MKREECVVGAQVFTCDGLSYMYEVVAPPDEKGVVEVKPTWRGAGSLDKFHLDDLYLFSEEKVRATAAQLQSKIDAAKNAFEVAFEAVREIRNFKSEDGIYYGRHDLADFGASFRSLENMLDDNGWSSSSLWC